MMKALVQGTRICEVRADTFPVHPSLQWVDVADDTTELDTWDGTQVVKHVTPVETPQEVIERLERQITPRRMREAVLGTDGGWLANQEALIAAERGKL